jgi:hypothetical protein
MFQEEKPFLKKLPLIPFRYFAQQTRTVWDDGCIEVKAGYYPALPAPLFSQVLVRIYDLEIEILDPKTLLVLRRHTRHERRGHVNLEESDRIYNPSRQTKAILEQASKIGPKARELCEGWFNAEGRTGQRRMRGVVSLARKFPVELIEQAAAIAIRGQIKSCGAVKELVRRLADQKAAPPAAPNSPLTQEHELIRDGKEYAKFFEQYADQGDLFTDPTLH